METKFNTKLSSESDNFVTFHNGQGSELRATLLRLTPYQIVFELYNTYVLRLSEVLTDFKIMMNDSQIYSGRAVVNNLVNTGTVVVCEATLDEAWQNLNAPWPLKEREKLRADLADSLGEWGKISKVYPEFKIVVADMQILFMDLRRWMEQIELGVRSQPAGNRLEIERDVLQSLEEPIVSTVGLLLEKFEEIAQRVEPDLQPAHKSYMKRQIHPLVLSSPFLYRTLQKPLGYAGDYEMVDMMLREPYEGSSMFAKMLNKIFLNTAPVLAHRDRITYLTDTLVSEAKRVACLGRPARIYNLGCGPAKEIQNFLSEHDISSRTELTLLDFNDETLAHTSGILQDLKTRHRRITPIQMVKRSVSQLLKEASKPISPGARYDYVYCAGLFDYLDDRICKRMTNLFYELLAPGGLLVVTNVESANPSRNWMEYVLEWHLLYRNNKQLNSLNPDKSAAEKCAVLAIGAGVNISLEVRKPEDAT
jgi:extracellular factor (EF) 3-hydroxypalmitic acid methyl ester biosynthesis protein